MEEKALAMALSFVDWTKVVTLSQIGEPTSGKPTVEEVAEVVVKVARIFEAYLKG